MPLPDPTAVRERALLEGDIPSAMNPPPGCRFHTRCRFAKESCRSDEPALTDDGFRPRHGLPVVARVPAAARDPRVGAAKTKTD